MLFFKILRKPLVLMVSGLVIALMLAVYIGQPPLLQQLDRNVYDELLLWQEPGTASAVPVIIDIDEPSLAAYGQWPWPRYRIALLAAALYQGGIAAAGLDILLAEADRTSPGRLREAMGRELGVNMDFTGLPEQLYDNDALLAQTLENCPLVLGCYLHFSANKSSSPTEEYSLWPSTGYVVQRGPDAPPGLAGVPDATAVTLPLPVFAGETPPGFINAAPDPDGVIRSVPMLLRMGDTLYANLSVRVLMQALGTNTIALRSGPGGLESMRIKKYEVRLTPQGALQLPFRGPRGVYPYYSAKDVLEGKIPPEALKGKVAFIGTSAPGLLDIRTTPWDSVYPGVEAHAAVVDAVLSNRSVFMPVWMPGAQALAIVFSGLLGALLFGFAGPLFYVPMGVATLVAMPFGASHLFAAGIFFSPLYAMLTLVLQALALLALRFFQEEKQKRALRTAFSHYVSPEVVARIAESGVVLAGEQKELTVLFTDIRGFTSIAEKLDPPRMVSLLNRYFTPMTALIRDHNGTLDKFIGDAIMAFWNAPLDVPGHSCLAIATTLHMRRELRTLNPGLMKDFGIELNIGAGLHTGPVYVGNMGSAELLNYTCIGDTVNLASRLEALCPHYGAELIVSSSTMRHCLDDQAECSGSTFPADGNDISFLAELGLDELCCGNLTFLYLDSIRVKGKAQAVDIYLPVHAPALAPRVEELKTRRLAMDMYRDGRFEQARQVFMRLDGQRPLVFYKLYAERCAQLAAEPPPHWDGVWSFSSK